ncbi:MAG: M48 family metallopeptidase [Nanoarchaeota archaeon]
MSERISFHEQIQRNKLKSIALMALAFLILIALGYVISMFLNPGFFFIIMSFSIILSLGYIVFSYYNSDKLAIASVSAEEVKKAQYPRFHNLVEGLTIASGMPMPRLYIMHEPQINAFAAGRDPQHSVICATTGALEKLDKEELEGVLAHELSHIANYDIRFITLVAVLVGLVSIISELFLRSLWYNSNDNKGKNPALLIIGIALAIIAPIAVTLIQFAVSRKREFTADATGVKFTRYPNGLASALKKIRHDTPTKNINKAIAPLFMSDPFRNKIANLFSTHPPIDERIRVLEAM